MENGDSVIKKEEHTDISVQNTIDDDSSKQRSNRTIRMAICDLSPTIRSGLQHILSSDSDIEIVLTVASQAEVIDKADGMEIDVIEFDIDDDTKPGLEYLKKFRENLPKAKIMVFTDCCDHQQIMEAVEMGVEAFQCKKDAKPDEIVNAVRTVHNGGRALSPCITEVLLGHMVSMQDRVKVKLSSREQEVLDLIGQGKSNHDIADTLSISIRTVKFHVSAIFLKLDVKNRTQAALWAP